MSIIVTGSIAFDYLMSFPGKFTEHFLPEHMNRVSLSFLVDSMDKRRGGCAPNIAYTLALLGERPRLMGTAGQDFDEYGRWLEAAGIDTSLVKRIPDKFTASFFCSTDVDSNQIASFYTGAMANAAELSFRTVPHARIVIISPNDPAAMVQYAEECRTLGLPFVWDPGQQCARMSGQELAEGIHGAAIVICNDYEIELMKQKTGLDEDGIVRHAGALIVTPGQRGRNLRPRTPWRAEPQLHLGRVCVPLRDPFRPAVIPQTLRALPPLTRFAGRVRSPNRRFPGKNPAGTRESELHRRDGGGSS